MQECKASGVARRVLLLCPDQLAAPGRVRRAHEALDRLTLHARARRHDLPDERLAVSWPGDNAALPATLAELPRLAPGYLARLFELPRDGASLLAELEPRVEPREAPQRGKPLDPESASALERGLAQADLSRFARRAQVVRQTGQGARLAWEKRYVCLADLADTLAPGRDLLADRQRLRMLCRLIDQRMLRLLTDLRELDGAAPFALNLNVASLAGPEFARFDGALPLALRGRVTLVVSLDDVLADPDAFAGARDAVRRVGYRVLLRGLTAALVGAVALDRLSLDYVQLRWSSSIAPLRLQTGGAEAVLTGVDGPAAVRWAAREGVTLFQSIG